MRAGMITLLLGAMLLGISGCKQQPPPDQNIVIDNDVLANADIEALPPDESSATPSNQLVNGEDNPDVNDLDNNSSDY